MKAVDFYKIPKCEVTRTCLVLDADLSFDEWEAIGPKLIIAEASAVWWIGDWINYGREKFQQRDQRGRFCDPEAAKRYELAMQITLKSRKTLKNYAWLSAAIPASRRRDSVSPRHFEIVAAFPEQDMLKWIDAAEKEGLSAGELRARVRAATCDESALSSGGPSVKFAQAMPVRFLADWLRKQSDDFWTPDRIEYWRDFMRPLFDFCRSRLSM